MACRSALFALAVLGMAFAGTPATAQHGRDPVPPAQTTSPSGSNPTEQSVNEQKLLQELSRVEGRVSIPDDKAAVLVQPQGRNYQYFHERILPWLSGILIVGMIVALAIFYFIRGRIKLEDSPETGIKVLRFSAFERLVHWLTATAFIVLALTGLNYIFGKRLIFPLIGPDAFGAWSQWAKYTHISMAFVFMLGVLLMLVMWIRGNIPDRYDWRWLKEFGGFMSGSHPPARRFNAGQKLIFWSVVIFGIALTASGIVMLAPFWAFDINGMQWTQYVHSVAGSIMIAIILAHIYIGTLGMVGAFSAMQSGEVDLAWARAHHSVWAQEVDDEARRSPPPVGAPGPIPAE